MIVKKATIKREDLNVKSCHSSKLVMGRWSLAIAIYSRGIFTSMT